MNRTRASEVGRAENKRPWYQRTNALLLSAGAVAAALASIFGLVNLLIDPQDLATVSSVTLKKKMPLADFATEGLGGNITFAEAVPAHQQDEIPDVARLLMSTSIPVLVPETSAQLKTPSPSTPDVSQSPTRTSDNVPPTTSASTPVSPSVTATTSPTRSTSSSRVTAEDLPPEDHREEVQKQLERRNVPPDISSALVFIAPSQAVDAGTGELLPPAQVAEELKKALEELATDETSAPTGWMVGVQIELQGFANDPLLLTWSLDGVDVPETWQAENLAYKISASTQHDKGVAEIWVPELARTGAYQVNVTLTQASSRVAVASGHLVLPR